MVLVVLYDCCTQRLPTEPVCSSALARVRADTLLTTSGHAAASPPRWFDTWAVVVDVHESGAERFGN